MWQELSVASVALPPTIGLILGAGMAGPEGAVLAMGSP